MKRFVLMLFFSLLVALGGQLHDPVSARVSLYDEGVTYLRDIDQFNNIVIFIRFADETDYEAPYSYTYYENLFNGVDTVSLRDYYLDVSYGQLAIDSYLIAESDQIIFYTDIYDRGYYQPYDLTTNPDGYTASTRNKREHELLKRAIDYVEANDLVPDSLDIDVNNDGDIDSLTFVVSGEAGDWNVLLWPHKWEMSTYYNYSSQQYTVDAPKINGKYAYYYTFNLLGNEPDYQYMVDVPVLAHETFHLVSAPDLYHYYRYTWIEPVGDWGLMESLTDVPSHMLGYMKYQYGGWIDTVTEITESGTYTIYPLQDSPNNLYRIDTGYSNEYVYLEYRDNDGPYESNLPASGLIAYRVDDDYLDDGNVDGYYLDDGVTPANEVFIFRPGLYDMEEPIFFEADDRNNRDEDGQIDDAALSQFNAYDEMGIGTSIPMFYSDGTLMSIKIYDVVEHDGYLTFSIIFDSPRIELSTNLPVQDLDRVNFVNHPASYYSFRIRDVNPAYDVYYTLDGSTPTTSSTLYAGGDIVFTSDLNHLQAIIVDGATTVGTLDQMFTFVDAIATDHDNYGNDVNAYYFLQFEHFSDFTVSFDNQTFVESDYDFISLWTGEFFDTYTGGQLGSETFDYLDYGFLLEFTTDGSEDAYYGFDVSITVNDVYDQLGGFLNGSASESINVNEAYDEQGVTLVGDGMEDAYYTTSGTVDTTTMGVYTITYDIYDATDTLVQTLVREVTVGDFIAPTLTLLGDTEVTVEVGEAYEEAGVEVFDNLPFDGEVVVTTILDTNKVGDYQIYYQVTDAAGNTSNVLIRLVYVRDSVAPTAQLNAGVDTIRAGEPFLDASVTATDNYTTEPGVEIISDPFDTTVPGTYAVVYRVTDSSGNAVELTRYVTVVAQTEEPIVACDPGISTYVVDPTGSTTELDLPACTINGVTTQIDLASVDFTQPGTYEIEYYVTINGERLTHTSYVFVIVVYDLELAYYDNRKGDYL